MKEKNEGTMVFIEGHPHEFKLVAPNGKGIDDSS